MEWAYLNLIGLLFGLLGVVLIFFWGPPQPDMAPGVGIGLEDATTLKNGRTVAEHDADVRKVRKRYTYISKVGLACVGLGFLCQLLAQVRPYRTVEANRLVLRDKQGRLRVEMAMSYDFGANGNPLIRLLDENGKERTTIGAGVLTISGDKGTQATILDGRLQFSGTAGVTATLNGELGREGLWLFGHDGENGGGNILLDAKSGTIEVADANGFSAHLGSNELVTTRTGERTTTSAASLVLSAKDGKVLWSAP